MLRLISLFVKWGKHRICLNTVLKRKMGEYITPLSQRQHFMTSFCYWNAERMKRMWLQCKRLNHDIQRTRLPVSSLQAFDSVLLSMNQTGVLQSRVTEKCLYNGPQFIFLVHLCVRKWKLPPKSPLFIYISLLLRAGDSAGKWASLWH